MVLDKIDVDRIVSPVKPVQRVAQKGTSGAFEDALEDFRRSKPAETNHSAEAEGDAVFTRLLTDGSVLVQVYRGQQLTCAGRMQPRSAGSCAALRDTRTRIPPPGVRPCLPLAQHRAQAPLPHWSIGRCSADDQRPLVRLPERGLFVYLDIRANF